MDPHNPINPKDDHSQQPKRRFPPIDLLSAAEEKLLDEYCEWEHEAKYRLQQDSDDDSDDAEWLSSPIVTHAPRLPMNYYPKEPPVWATYGEGLSSAHNRATVEAEKNTLPVEPPCATTRQWPSQDSSSSQHRAAVEAEKITLPVEQEIAYFNMLNELTKIDTTTMSEVHLRAHEGQNAFLCNKLGIHKP